MKKRIRDIWFDYQSEFFFGAGLIALTVLSYWLGSFMSEEIFESYINPIEYFGTATVCFFGASLLFLHQENNHLRRSWAIVLLIWGCMEIFMWAARYLANIKAVGGTPDDPLFNTSVTIGNIIAFLLFIYPTQVLRPGWLNGWRAALLLLPMIILGIVDYFVPANLLPWIMLYPTVIFLLLCRHVRKYRQWCEDNFSTMDDIDVQWIVRYLTMLFIVGVAFYFIVFWYLPNRMFTQQWTLLLILTYTTERVLFRPDPWEKMKKDDAPCVMETEEQGAQEADPSARAILDEWMEKEKPYLDPEFQLKDLYRVLPINRTYLSQLINAEYGCSFFQWVNAMRINEAKRILSEEPDLKLNEVASRCGFSSRQAFSRVFTRETGLTPREWALENPNTNDQIPTTND